MKFKVFSNQPVIFKLKNGLNVHLIHEPSHVCYTQVDIPIGSFHLKYQLHDQIYDITPGAAHFLEHKMFMMPEGDAFNKLTELGVNANALTTYRQTTYMLNGAQNFMEATLYLLKMLDTPYFTDESIESEKKIIKEEIQMYADDPDTLIYQKIYQLLLWNHPLLHEITGSIEDISTINKEQLNRLYQAFYHSSERQLIIAGPIDVEDVKKTLLAYDRDDIIHLPIKHVLTTEPKTLRSNEDTIYVDISLPILSVGFKYQQNHHQEELLFKTEMAMLFLTQMIFGSNAPLTEKLINDEIINDQFSMQLTMEDETMIFVMDVHCEDTIKLKELILSYFFDEGLKDLTEIAFELLKRAYLGSYIMALDDIENRIFLYGKYHLNGMRLEQAIEILNAFELKDVIALYHAFSRDMIAVLHSLPKIQK